MMSQLPSFGQGQTWQDVTGSRAGATTYTNTTGKPIGVLIGTAGVSRTPTVNGVALAAIGISVSGFFIVPPNHTYSLSATPNMWLELR